MTESKPSIMLEPGRVICKLHGQPFRANWPEGYVKFLLFAMNAVLGQEGFVALAGGNVETINALLDDRPLCCRMSPEKRLEAYAQSGIGHPGYCRLCRQHRTVVDVPIGQFGLPHAVCFRCFDRLEVQG